MPHVDDQIQWLTERARVALGKLDSILNAWEAGASSTEIEQALGVSASYVRVLVQNARLRGDKRAVPRRTGPHKKTMPKLPVDTLCREARLSFEREAVRRQTTVPELKTMVLEAVANGHLFAAVLDD